MYFVQSFFYWYLFWIVSHLFYYKWCSWWPSLGCFKAPQGLFHYFPPSCSCGDSSSVSYGSLQPDSAMSLAQDMWLSSPDLGCPCCYWGMRFPRTGSTPMHSKQKCRKMNLKENHTLWILERREMGASRKVAHLPFPPSHALFWNAVVYKLLRSCKIKQWISLKPGVSLLSKRPCVSSPYFPASFPSLPGLHCQEK